MPNDAPRLSNPTMAAYSTLMRATRLLAYDGGFITSKRHGKALRKKIIAEYSDFCL